MKKLKSTVSLLLVVFILASLFPFSVTADNIIDQNDFAENEIDVFSEEQTEEKTAQIKPIILREDVSRREESVKHFLCEDGSYIAVTYPKKIHIEENGEFFEKTADYYADNSTENETAVAEGKTMRLSDGKYNISWEIEVQFDNAEKTKINTQEYSKNSEGSERTPIDQDKLDLLISEKNALYNKRDNLTAQAYEKNVSELNASIDEYNRAIFYDILSKTETIEYKRAFSEDIDVKYTVTGSDVKEDVILNKPNEFESYSVKISAKDLNAVLHEEGYIQFVDDEENDVFSITVPFMYDSAGEESYDIAVTLNEENSDYIITYTPDKEWLNAPERVYPVVLDPLYFNNGDYNMSEAFVSAKYPTESYPSYGFLYMYVGNTSAFGRARTYLKFNNLPNMTGKIITDSYLDLKLDTGTTSIGNISAYIPSSTWTLGLLNWNNQPGVEHLFKNNCAYGGSYGSYFYQIHLGILPTQWHFNSSAKNRGLMIKYSNDNENDYNRTYGLNSANTGKYPILTYYYIDEPAASTGTEAVIANGVYTIKNAYNGKCFTQDIYDGTVYASENTNEDTQQWSIQRQLDGTYTFSPVHTPNFRLETHCGQYVNYRPITVYDYVTDYNLGSPHIRFRIYENSDGTISIRPVNNTSFAITVFTGQTGPAFFYNEYTASFRRFYRTQNSFLQLFAFDSSNLTQKWYLESTNGRVIRNEFYSAADLEWVNYNFTQNEDEGMLKRMNCYGYAFGLNFYENYQYVDVPLDYLREPSFSQDEIFQQPGGFALGTELQQDYILLKKAINAESFMGKVINNVSLDMQILGYSMERYYPPQNGPVEQFGNNCRLIAVVTKDNNYHFYKQNNNGTWSHKFGQDVATEHPILDITVNGIVYGNNVLDNSNIQQYARCADYSNGALRFYKITKPAAFDFAHNYDEETVFDGDENSTMEYSFEMISTIPAGDHLETSYQIEYDTELCGKMDSYYDRDVYYFVAPFTGTFTISAETIDSLSYCPRSIFDLDCVVKRYNGSVLTTSSSSGPVNITIYLYAGQEIFIELYDDLPNSPYYNDYFFLGYYNIVIE